MHNGTNGAATIVDERKLRVCPEVMMLIMMMMMRVMMMIIIIMNMMNVIIITIIMVIMTPIKMFPGSSQLDRYMMIIVMFIIIHES